MVLLELVNPYLDNEGKVKICSWFGSEILTAVAMKSSILWDITQSSTVSQPTLLSNISTPFLGSKSKMSKNPAWSRQWAEIEIFMQVTYFM
jgi:hypothetical protein